VADILFIHGLGGTSLRSWCRNRELEFLWPKTWLPKETDLAAARILTFGYNAHFSATKQQAALTINDFATDLLYSMKYSLEEGGEKMGQVPIIIVAHSMGGLVFKKACKCSFGKERIFSLIGNFILPLV
jgi:pimeloyl-ACP methyl ester carboxylesterase